MQHLVERVEFLLHEEPHRRRQQRRNAAHRRMRAMRRAKRVVDVDVAVLRQLARERGIAILLGVAEAQVLEHQALAGLQRLRCRDRIVADAVAARLHWRAEQFLQLLRRRQKPHRLHDLALGPSEVRHQDGLAARLQDRLDRRQALANARVARDLQVLVERHVEVDAHEHALLGEIEVREFLGHGATERASNPRDQRWAAIFFVRSTTRLL